MARKSDNTALNYLSDTVIGADENNRYVSVKTATGSEIKLSDQTSESFAVFLAQTLGTFTITANVVIDDRSFTATAGHGLVVGNFITMSDSTRFFQAEVVGVATDLITLDSPFDYAFNKNTVTCKRVNIHANVNGGTTPVHFSFGPTAIAPYNKWHVTHMSLYISDGTEMDDGKFGGITKLTNGLIIRKTSPTFTKNLFNIKTNGALNYKFDELNYSTKAPAGTYALTSRKRFNGQQYEGVVLELNSVNGDTVDLIVADNLTDLSDVRVMIHGHIVD